MSDDALHAALAALAAAVARPLDAGDARSGAAVVHDALEQRVLATYRAQLDELPEGDRFGWMLARTAAVEARVLAIQAALARRGAPPVAGNGAAASAPTAPATRTPEPAAAPPDALPGRVLVPCEELHGAKGLYPTEYDERGRRFRWLGPETRSRLFLPRVRGPFEVRMTVYSIYAAGSVESARFSVDGGEWATLAAESGGEHIVLRAQPRPGPSADGERVTLDIDVGIIDSPLNHGEDDDRRLSFAVSRVELVSV